MKKFLFILSAFLISLAVFSQTPTLVPGSMEYRKIAVDSVMGLPKDTLTLFGYFKSTSNIAVKNDSILYVWSPALNRWIQPRVGAASVGWADIVGVISSNAQLNDSLAKKQKVLPVGNDQKYISGQHTLLDFDSMATVKGVVHYYDQAFVVVQNGIVDSFYFINGLQRIGKNIGALYDNPIWNAFKIQGRPVSPSQPLNGQTLQFDSISGALTWRHPDSSSLALAVKYTDTAAMLGNYLTGATAGYGIIITGSKHKTWAVDTAEVSSKANVTNFYNILNGVKLDKSDSTNKWVQIVYKDGNDTLWTVKNGIYTNLGKMGAATIPNLQQVTDVWNRTTNEIVTNRARILVDDSTGFGRAMLGLDGDDNGYLKLHRGNSGNANHNVTLLSSNLTDTRNLQLPDSSGTLVLSVNGNFADSKGNVTVTAAGDNWGTQVVQHDATLTGDGTSGSNLKVDTSVISTKANATDLYNILNGVKLNKSDTATMLTNYLHGASEGWGINITGSQHKTWAVDSLEATSWYHTYKIVDSLKAEGWSKQGIDDVLAVNQQLSSNRIINANSKYLFINTAENFSVDAKTTAWPFALSDTVHTKMIFFDSIDSDIRFRIVSEYIPVGSSPSPSNELQVNYDKIAMFSRGNLKGADIELNPNTGFFATHTDSVTGEHKRSSLNDIYRKRTDGARYTESKFANLSVPNSNKTAAYLFTGNATAPFYDGEIIVQDTVIWARVSQQNSPDSSFNLKIFKDSLILYSSNAGGDVYYPSSLKFKMTPYSYAVKNLPGGNGNKSVRYNTSTGEFTYADTTIKFRFGVSGEDDVANENRTIDLQTAYDMNIWNAASFNVIADDNSGNNIELMNDAISAETFLKHINNTTNAAGWYSKSQNINDTTIEAGLYASRLAPNFNYGAYKGTHLRLRPTEFLINLDSYQSGSNLKISNLKKTVDTAAYKPIVFNLADSTVRQFNSWGELGLGGGGSLSVGTINGTGKSANAAVISSGTLYMQTFDSEYPGVVPAATNTGYFLRGDGTWQAVGGAQNLQAVTDIDSITTNSIKLYKTDPSNGNYAHSPIFSLTGKGNNGSVHSAEWKTYVEITATNATSNYRIDKRYDGGAWENYLKLGGDNSVSFYNATASNDYVFAQGEGVSVTGYGSATLGTANATIDGTHNVQIGGQNTEIYSGTIGAVSAATDSYVYGTADYAFIMNDANNTRGESSLTGGFGNENWVQNGVVLGSDNILGALTAGGGTANQYQNSFAFGRQIRTTGSYTFTAGRAVAALKDESMAIGYGINATSTRMTVSTPGAIGFGSNSDTATVFITKASGAGTFGKTFLNGRLNFGDVPYNSGAALVALAIDTLTGDIYRKAAGGGGGIYGGSGSLPGNVTVTQGTNTLTFNSSTSSNQLFANNTSDGTAINGTANSGVGVWGESASGTSVLAIGGDNVELFEGIGTQSNTSTVRTLTNYTLNSSGTAANGFGQQHNYLLETSSSNSILAARQVISWSDATHSSRTTWYDIKGMSNATEQRFLNVQPSVIRFNNDQDTVASRDYARSVGGGGGGEANTASNTGTVGIGIFKQKTVADLEFYKINSQNTLLTIALNGSDRVDLTVNQSNFTVARTTIVTTAVGTDANITAAAGTAYHLQDGVITQNRTIDVTNLDTNGDYVEFYNNETGFLWSFTGATVVDSDGVTEVSSLLINTNSVIRRINGKLMISKL